jgi:uncharacterized protein (DUF58 family)
MKFPRPKFLARWVEERLPRGEIMRLTHRCVYILPTRFGLLFAALLLTMLAGAINYANSLAFALAFLLGGMAVVSILHTYRNLEGLTLHAGRVAPVFAGEQAAFRLGLHNHRPGERHAIQVGDDDKTLLDLPGQRGGEAVIALPARQRGLLRPGRMGLQTVYPLGLFRAWSWVAPDMSCMVYPAPEPGHPPLPVSPGGQEAGRRQGAGQEDFRGLRDYHPGDSPRHVAWKALARGQEMFTKEFEGSGADELWLGWEHAGGLGIEARLSRLARWVIDAEAQGLSYGLRLPSLEIPPGRGADHRHQCLSALALYQDKA